jgi:hypothetical protein
LHLGLAPPRLALGKPIAAAATREHAEDAKEDGADEIPANSPCHGRENASDFVNDSSTMSAGPERLVRALQHG